MEESSSDDDFVDSETEDERRRADHAVTDTDHWLIQKLIRYIKVLVRASIFTLSTAVFRSILFRSLSPFLSGHFTGIF